RVKAGLANAKRRGRKVGRPRAIVSMMNVHEMAEQGLSARAIAKAIGVSDYTVRKILRRCEKTPSAEAPSDARDSAPSASPPRRGKKRTTFHRAPPPCSGPTNTSRLTSFPPFVGQPLFTGSSRKAFVPPVAAGLTPFFVS